MKPTIKVFTREAPCTKWDIWHCFISHKGFCLVEVAEAQAKIGVNVPRVMEREGRLERVQRAQHDYYKLTPAGQEWLLKGFRAYLKNHPTKASKAAYAPADWFGKAPAPVARLRRTR